MPAAAMVDAALAGFDQGELVTIPSLHAIETWQAYESARQSIDGPVVAQRCRPRATRRRTEC